MVGAFHDPNCFVFIADIELSLDVRPVHSFFTYARIHVDRNLALEGEESHLLIIDQNEKKTIPRMI